MRHILQMTAVSIKSDQKYILAEERDKRDNSSSTSSLSLLERELAPENELPGNHLMFLLSMQRLCQSGTHYCRVSYLQHL